MSNDTVDNIASYNGIKLVKEQSAALYDLETLIREKIPCKGISFYKSGFVHQNHVVTGLSLCRKQLQLLPESIGILKNLKRLYLRDNQLTSLPDSIGNLQFLENLDVFNNQINSLPEPIGNLKALKRLDLSNNYIENLPSSIGCLESLEKLGLYNVNLKNPPIEYRQAR